VPIVFDAATGMGTSLGVALNLPPSAEVRGDFVVVGVNERMNGHGDLDGDGDLSDRFVVHVYDAASGLVTNLRSADPVLGLPHAGDGFVAFAASESERGADLNDDGDLADSVAHVLRRGADVPCALGGANAAAGAVRPVLRVDGTPGVVTRARGASFELSLASPPAGPSRARYVLWAWLAPPGRSTDLVIRGNRVGCTTNPTPFAAPAGPQPVRCVHSFGAPPSACAGIRERSAPSRAPWSLASPRIAGPATLTLQGVVEDASSPLGFSITNAVVVRIP
jgi:hypothetical protein